MAGPAAEAARSAQRARRSARAGARRRPPAVRPRSSPGSSRPDRSILVARSRRRRRWSSCWPSPGRWPAPQPPRELILARLLAPPRGAAVRGALQTENIGCSPTPTRSSWRRATHSATSGIAARGVATITADAGADLDRLARSEEVDLVLIDGRRPLLGEGVPRGRRGRRARQGALATSPCWWRRRACPILTGGDRSIVVPFGGAEHDWAALELAAWLGAAAEHAAQAAGRRGPERRGPGHAAAGRRGPARAALRGRVRAARGGRAGPRGRAGRGRGRRHPRSSGCRSAGGRRASGRRARRSRARPRRRCCSSGAGRAPVRWLRAGTSRSSGGRRSRTREPTSSQARVARRLPDRRRWSATAGWASSTGRPSCASTGPSR